MRYIGEITELEAQQVPTIQEAESFQKETGSVLARGVGFAVYLKWGDIGPFLARKNLDRNIYRIWQDERSEEMKQFINSIA
tara:strand:+ start:4951 stop:5193 length:243 start_codon:yes stop_codon:yes gene_type:complete